MLKVAEKKNLKELKVKDHIKLTKYLTHSSHVSYFGDESILNMKLIEFFKSSTEDKHTKIEEEDDTDVSHHFKLHHHNLL